MSANLYDEITAKLIAQMEAGTPPWIKPWVTAGLPHNAVSGHEYQGINPVLLWCEMQENEWTANGWLTFNQLRAAGGQLKPLPGFDSTKTGQRSTTIVRVGTFEKETVAPNGDKEKRGAKFLRTYRVFNLDQTMNLPPEMYGAPLEVTNPLEYEPRIELFVERSNIQILYGGPEAYYRPARDHIRMPHRSDFKAVADYHCTRFHEMTHATGHPKRLNRFKDGAEVRSSTVNYAMEELTAEIGAAYLCGRFGVKGNLQHASYLQHYVNLMKADRKAIFTAASRASKASDYLVKLDADALDREAA